MSIELEGYKAYRKVGTQLMRPYIPGENMDGISISPRDIPTEGGMIAINPNDMLDRWYIAKDFFEENYEPAE